MRRGILVAAVALGTLVAGCRDFQVPPLGYQGPLKVVPDHLAVAPQEQATLQVEGGTPPYTIQPATGSSGSTSYLAFPLTAQGSGGFAAVDGTQVDYAAGTGDATSGQGTADTFVVRDAKGAEVKVDVAIGPPVALTFGSGGAPLSVPAGGTLLLGATGGKGPYLYGLATAASGGTVDAVTGRYRAGDVGCVSDTLLVRDDLGATAVAPVSVQCPARPDSPRNVVAARLADIGGANRLYYFTSLAGGSSIQLPIFGGTPLQLTLPGPVVDATSPHQSGGLVVAVREFDGIHLLSYTSVGGGQAGTELVATGTGYPIPTGSVFHLTSGAHIPAVSTGVAVATWTTPAGATFAARMQVGVPQAPVVSIPSQTAAGAGSGDATLRDFSATGAPALDYVHFYLPSAGAQVEAVVDTGGGFGGQAALTVPVSFEKLLAVAGSDGGDVALLGIDAQGNRVVAQVTYDGFNRVFSAPIPPVQVQADARLLAFGHIRGSFTEDYVVVGKRGEVRLVFTDAAGNLQARRTPWFLPPDVQDLFVGDIDGNGVAEILASGDPAGDPAIEINPSALPQQSPPSRGVYGAGALSATSVGTVTVPGARPAIFAIDSGHLADGSDAPAGAGGGELALLTGGADVGDPVEVKIPVTDAVVTQVVGARLRQNDLGLPANPTDLVASVKASDGSFQVWVALYTQPGLAPELVALGGSKSPTSFAAVHLAVVPVAGTSPARDAVLLVDAAGVRALRWDPTAPDGLGLSQPLTGTYGWPARNLGDAKHPDTLVSLRQVGTGSAATLTLTRLGLDATGAELVPGDDVVDPFTGKPVVIQQPSLAPLAELLAAPIIAHYDDSYGQMVAVLVNQQILELGSGDVQQCTLDVPGTVSGMALIRPTSDGSALVAVLDRPDGILRTVKLFGGFSGEAVVDRQVLQGSPVSVAAGQVVGDDDVPDVVVGGTPLTVFPGVPDALLTVRRPLTCQ